MANPLLRRAFTLVELLVVIAIIGILVGLMLPAVQMARESGRRAACLNNISQLGLAMQSYESASRKYPPNWGAGPEPGTGPAANSSLGHSWLTYILPYLDEKPLYDSIKFGAALNYSDGRTNNAEAAARTIATFKCPSDSHDGKMSNQMFQQNQPVSVTNYKSCAGANWEFGTFKWCKSDGMADASGAVKKYTGRNAKKYDGRDYGDGVICRGWGDPATANHPEYAVKGKPVVTSQSDIRDGTSKTFACGEVVPEYSAWCSWYWWNNATATCAMPPNYEDPNKLRRENANDWQTYSGFHSRHPGGANFCMLDRSSHFIADTIELSVYRAFATIDGGEVASLPD